MGRMVHFQMVFVAGCLASAVGGFSATHQGGQGTAPATSSLRGASNRWQVVYASSNLATHSVSFESSPGDSTTNCPCGMDDVAIVKHGSYAEVISNVRRTNFYVNAIGYQRFQDTYPDGTALDLGIFRYKAEIRLPVLPSTDPVQTQNAQTVQMMLQMWDGTNRVWQADKHAIEATMYWGLNAWEGGYYERIKVYTDTTGRLELVDTGIRLPGDTNWHTVEFVADMVNRKWVSIRVDTNLADISGIAIPLVERTNWGNEVLYHITQESCATYPGPGYLNIFTWTTEFRNVELSKLCFFVDLDATTSGSNNVCLQWDSEPFLKYQVKTSADLRVWGDVPGILTGTGTNLRYEATSPESRLFHRIGVAR
ncbi:MAG: hypothetical protein C0404_02320 [Verrucomicrobia bacterium]|nr:hypothetical protein [Verrucomicrobiota bacterium]